MNLRQIVFGAMALMVITSSCGGGANPFAQTNTAPQEYKTAVLSEESVELETVYPVTIKGQEDIEIRPRIDGFIDAIYIDEGSVVRKGQALFKINSPSAIQAVTTAKAAVASAEAQLQTAKLNVDRIKPLADKGIVSTTQLATYQNAYNVALATKNQAEATLANANATLGWTNVTSPVDGVVGTIAFRQGSLVNNSNVLTTVSSIGSVFAYFSLNEKDLVSLLANLPGKNQAEKIKNLPKVSLRMADGTMYPEKGVIKTISGQVNVTTGSVNLRAEFTNSEGLLRSGFSGNLLIPKHIEKALVVPQAATLTKQNKLLIYKVVSDSIAVQTLIDVAATPDGKRYVVTNGLAPNDRVVVDGIATLSDSARIIVKK